MKPSTSLVVPGKRKASYDSDADEMAGFGSGTQARKRVPTEIWEAKRPIITRLYQEEKKSLKEVMEVMQKDYHFTATVKMYKSRIWKWGLDKKLKGDEVLAILLLKRDRDAMKKRSEYTIRGQVVDLDNINRYLKRNPSLMAKYRAGQMPSIQTTLEVACRTPSPSPSPSRALAPSNELQSVEQVLGLFRDYIDGSFTAGAWSCEYDVECANIRFQQEDRSNELFERVIASFALVNRCMVRGDKIDINSVLGPSFESLKEIVAAESPDFVARTVCLLWYLDRHHKHDLLRLVLDYLSGLVPIVLGQNHILTHIWRRLGATDFSDYYELSMRLYGLLLPEIEERVGPANYLTHLLYSDYIDCIFARQGPEECESILRRHRARVDASGKDHAWLGDMALSHAALLAACKEEEGRLDEAIEVLTAHMNAYSMTEEQEAAVNLDLGVKYYRMENLSAAITCFKSAARIALTADADERISMTALANMERLLHEAGKPGRAERVHRYRMERLAAFAEMSVSISKGPRIYGDFMIDSEDDASRDLPEWLWKMDEDEEAEEELLWTEIPMRPSSGKTSPHDYTGGCPNFTLDWTDISTSTSPAVMSTGVSPLPEDCIERCETGYFYRQAVASE